ncbi:MAG: hypothetical protein JOZ49_23400 [Mycolicibacterium sp.]|nr:hypothetical protein [Mycolicibacterium sp.]
MAERPAALDCAREAAELAAHHDGVAAQLAERDRAAGAAAAARAALGGPGHAAARAIADQAARRAPRRRTQSAGADTAHLDALIRAARTQPGGPAAGPGDR